MTVRRYSGAIRPNSDGIIVKITPLIGYVTTGVLPDLPVPMEISNRTIRMRLHAIRL